MDIWLGSSTNLPRQNRSYPVLLHKKKYTRICRYTLECYCGAVYIKRTVIVDVSLHSSSIPPHPFCNLQDGQNNNNILFSEVYNAIIGLLTREGASTSREQDKWAFSRSTTKQTETTSDFFTPVRGKHTHGIQSECIFTGKRRRVGYIVEEISFYVNNIL